MKSLQHPEDPAFGDHRRGIHAHEALGKKEIPTNAWRKFCLGNIRHSQDLPLYNRSASDACGHVKLHAFDGFLVAEAAGSGTAQHRPARIQKEHSCCIHLKLACHLLKEDPQGNARIQASGDSEIDVPKSLDFPEPPLQNL